MKIKKGYLYVARGEKYIEEAVKAARRLKNINPEAHTTLISDTPLKLIGFDNVIVISSDKSYCENWKNGLLFKVRGLQHSPYRKTIYVDSDTYFVDDCNELFALLDYYDLCIAQSPADNSNITVDDKRLNGYMPYNAGVIVYRDSSEMELLLKRWEHIYHEKFRFYHDDQAPLMEALLEVPVNIYVLQAIYNFRLPFFVSIPGAKVKLLHGRTDNFDAIEKKVNRYPGEHRIWIPRLNRVISYRYLSAKGVVRAFVPGMILNSYRNAKKNLISIK